MPDATDPTRRCSKCGVRKPLDAFYTDPTHQASCRDCARARMLGRIRKRSEFMDAYKLERGCADCGWAGHPAALEFDHLPGSAKVIEVSRLRVVGTMQQLLDEIAKCEVVCANCHRIRTAERDRERGGRSNRDWDLRRDPVRGLMDDDAQPSLFDETA
jgi:hypothetical protein